MQSHHVEQISNTVNRQQSATRATVRLSALAQLVAMYAERGIKSVRELSELTGYTDRAIRKARAELECRNQGAETEPQCRNYSAERNPGAGTPVPPQKEIPPTPPKEKYNNITTLSTSSSRASEGAAAAAARIDYDDLEKQLVSACNGSLADPVNAQGLLDLSTPIAWLRNGCDLEADVLPVLRAIGRRDHGKRIGHWGYFTKAVSEAKNRRERGLPPPGETAALPGCASPQTMEILNRMIKGAAQ